MEVKVYADPNNVYEAIAAAYYEALTAIGKHDGLPSFGRSEHTQTGGLIALSELHPPEFHPFLVLDDAAMDRLVKSVKRYGIRNRRKLPANPPEHRQRKRKENEELYKQIGKLTTQMEWLKKT